MAIVCAAYATQRISSLRNGTHKLSKFGTYRASATKDTSVNTCAFIDTNPTENDNLRVARDPPGIGIRQPLFAFPRHSFGEVIQIDMAS